MQRSRPVLKHPIVGFSDVILAPLKGFKFD
jgi:hypothetical protein